MQGFSGKILPAGLEIFSENRRLDLAFPSNPGVTFAPRTKMTAWCGPLKGAKMEVNGSGGRLDRKTSKEKSVKKGKRQKEKEHQPEAWNRANHRQGSMILSVWPSVSGRTDKIILPGLPAVCDGLFHLWIGRSDTAFRLRHKGTAKKEIVCEPVKAPLWHKHKRNGPCIISLNCCLGVRQSPFLRLCGSRHTFVQNPFGRWCADG